MDGKTIGKYLGSVIRRPALLCPWPSDEVLNHDYKHESQRSDRADRDKDSRRLVAEHSRDSYEAKDRPADPEQPVVSHGIHWILALPPEKQRRSPERSAQ